MAQIRFLLPVLALASALTSIIGPTLVASQSTLLPQSSCHRAHDCYVIPGVLQLACYYNVNKCNCQNTVQSIHRIEFVNGECLMSKYGPCGANDAGLSVGCLDGFECIENQCRDPKPGSTPSNTPFEFNARCSEGCTFTPELRFHCDRRREHCVCRPELKTDVSGPIWDVRNYDGNFNCSVGKFGPCGTQNGMQVDCHGPGIQCVDGRCVDPLNPIAGVGGRCELTSDCEPGLICSGGNKCVVRKSLGFRDLCNSDEECSGSLVCRYMTPSALLAMRVCAPPL